MAGKLFIKFSNASILSNGRCPRLLQGASSSTRSNDSTLNGGLISLSLFLLFESTLIRESK